MAPPLPSPPGPPVPETHRSRQLSVGLELWEEGPTAHLPLGTCSITP